MKRPYTKSFAKSIGRRASYNHGAVQGWVISWRKFEAWKTGDRRNWRDRIILDLLRTGLIRLGDLVIWERLVRVVVGWRARQQTGKVTVTNACVGRRIREVNIQFRQVRKSEEKRLILSV